MVREAVSLVDTLGHDHLSLGGVASRLGVKPSALYNHVAGIDGLRHELAIAATHNLGAVLRDAIVARSGRAAVRELATAYRNFAAVHPGQYAFAMLPFGEHDKELAAAQSQIADLFVLVMQHAGLTDVDAVHTARMLRSAIHGYVSLESIDALTSPIDRDDSFERMLVLLETQIPD